MVRLRILSTSITFVFLSSFAFAGQPSVEAHRLEALHPSGLTRLPGYSNGWKKMLADPLLGPADSWVRDAGGPGSIKAVRTDDGKDVAIANICKPHDCHDYNFMFVIDPATKFMWGLKRTRGEAPKEQAFYGKPSPTMRRYLVQQLRQEFPDP